jgi:integrase
MRELVAVWQAVGNEGDFSTIVRLLILTLQRRAEIADLREPELDLNRERQIILPATRTKNGREHIVPLSAPAQRLLTIHPRRVDRMLLFGDGQRGFQGWSKAKARLDIEARRLLDPELMERFESRTGDLIDRSNREHADKQAKFLGFKSHDDLLHSIMPRWTLHDLRRTGATLVNDFSLAEPHVIEAILNHISTSGKAGVAGIYNRAKYETQKRTALERWAEFLMSALGSFEDRSWEGVDSWVVAARAKLQS